VAIDFRGLEVDIPRAQGPDGRDLGSAKWTLNGKVVWTTELTQSRRHLARLYCVLNFFKTEKVKGCS
jgi:hypothetical protein